jgi:enoyl-CoA hydratase
MSPLTTELLDGVLVLTLADAPRRNVMSASMCQALTEAVESASRNPDVKAIVITGQGSAFCAGADLSDLQAASRGQTERLEAVYESFMTVANSPLPTLAAVNGPAVGAGLNMALACDARIACESAVFDTRFLEIGLHPGGGHSWMLLRAVGWANASRMILGGQSVRPEEALRIGLIQAVVPRDDLIRGALDTLRTTRSVSRELLVRTKATLRHASQSDHLGSFRHETADQLWSLGRSEFADSIARFKQARR